LICERLQGAMPNTNIQGNKRAYQAALDHKYGHALYARYTEGVTKRLGRPAETQRRTLHIVSRRCSIENNPVKDHRLYRSDPMTGRIDIEPCLLYKRALAKQTLRTEPWNELDQVLGMMMIYTGQRWMADLYSTSDINRYLCWSKEGL
jgi:hypothetical protein